MYMHKEEQHTWSHSAANKRKYDVLDEQGDLSEASRIVPSRWRLMSFPGQAREEHGSDTPRIKVVKNWTSKRYLARFSTQCYGPSQEESYPVQANLRY
jgi:hypothetical protein